MKRRRRHSTSGAFVMRSGASPRAWWTAIRAATIRCSSARCWCSRSTSAPLLFFGGRYASVAASVSNEDSA
ncbi:hypothetical protein OKW45_004849 [Paraburkholderia sp. WSM4175]